MPGVKRFLKGSVQAGDYGDRLTVRFTGGTPRLILFNAQDEEIGREFITNNRMSEDELHAFVQARGFPRLWPPPEEEAEPEEKAEAEELLRQQQELQGGGGQTAEL